jgi:phospholipid/cholesterol/gamma-HCH transport system substrate-binding protein
MRLIPRGSGRSRRRRHRLHPLAVAALVIFSTLAVTFYAFNQGLPFSHQFTLHAVVADSVNVRGGDPVRIDGVDVGQVQGVSADGDASRIAFTLDQSALPIHRDASLRIRDRLFLEGSYYLALDPGTPEAPVLKDGGTIPMSRTTGPVQLYRVLSLFTTPVRQSLVGSVNQLAAGFATPGGSSVGQSGAGAIKQAASQFAPLFRDTALITQGLRGTAPGDLPRLLRSTASVTGTVAGSARQLTSLVSGLNTTATALASSDGALAQSVSGLDKTLAAAPPALSAVDAALPAVDRLARALDPSLAVAPPILDHLTGTVIRLAAVLAPAERGPLLVSLDATFRQLPSILTQLAEAFPIGKQITDCLTTHVIPILHRHVPDGSLSTGRSVLQDFVHFLPGLAGASGSFDADGPYTRFLAGAGPNTLTGQFGGQTLVGTSPPGGAAIQGARPQWFGDLQPSDFRPDVRCATQKVPSLASATSAPDLRSAK